MWYVGKCQEEVYEERGTRIMETAVHWKEAHVLPCALRILGLVCVRSSHEYRKWVIVAYSDLDVYKRQVLASPICFLGHLEVLFYLTPHFCSY